MGVGDHIRKHVIPPGMTVTEAARRMGVSRVALSNLLNGRTSLSTAMRRRLERTFGADPHQLREAQEEGERERMRNEEKAVRVRAYAPELVSIKARQISDWARNIASRQELAVLIRRLVHSTGHGIHIVDFPGYDNAERPGWDGRIEADESTAWIPSGKSGWEFGTSPDARKKAEDAYRTRLRLIGPADRSECTFVFVTPHEWPRKWQWVDSKREDGWRDVRALDASDLEQWLEESLTGQAWLAPRIGIPTRGVRTLAACWEGWTSRTKSPMTPVMFQPLVSMYTTTIDAWLTRTGSEPLVLSAESVDEALAFLACFSFTEDGQQLGEAAIVFDTPDALRTLATATSKMIVVICDHDMERELASARGEHPVIIVRTRNVAIKEPHITLPVLKHEQFRSGLVAMGIEDHTDVQRLVRKSGRSLTVLRRSLSDVRTLPPWSRDASFTEHLVPMALLGVWDTTSRADRRALEKLSERPYAEVEKTVSSALRADDRPIWQAGNHRGVVSRIDLLLTVAPMATASRVQLFFEVASDVLGEEDPALELSENERWMASIHGKLRRHSAALRAAVGETLVLLATYSKTLLPHLPEINLQSRVAAAIRDLLTPMSPNLALSQERDLPRYAEAAPETYLAVVEEDLTRSEPALKHLLRPTGRAPFLRFPRTGLLNGLECLAWSQKYLVPVIYVLAELSKTEVDDNCVNTPFNSLLSVFRYWTPQTSAPRGIRVKVLRQLCQREPQIGWRVCMDQLDATLRLSSVSYRPRWRDFATGHGESVAEPEAAEFQEQALQIALGWHHDAETLADLVTNLAGIHENGQLAVWRLIDRWSANANTTEEDRQKLGERVRGVALTRRGLRMLPTSSCAHARAVYEKLVPKRSVGRVAWLFTSGWVEETVAETDDDEGGTSRLDRMHSSRCDAMHTLWRKTGLEGIDQLLAVDGAPATIGRYLAQEIDDSVEAQHVVAYALERSDRESMDALLTGLFGQLSPVVLKDALQQVVGKQSNETIVRVLLCAPVRGETWRIMDGLAADVQDAYWHEVVALQSWGLSSAEWDEMVDRLLVVGRPIAVTCAADMQWHEIGTSRLKRVLQAVATQADDPKELVDPRVISDGMASLSERADVTRDELAVLELLLAMALEQSEYGIPNLEERISESPEMFVQLLGIAYKQDDEAEAGTQLTAARVAQATLRRMRVPGEGLESVDVKKLQQWVVEVRSLAASYGRAEVGDAVIGQLLARAAGDVDQGSWPANAIRQVIEAARSERMGHSFVTAIRNARGTTVRAVDEGGRQERDLAAVYAAQAEAQMIDFPFVSRVLRWLEESFESDAKRIDARTEVDQRLAH